MYIPPGLTPFTRIPKGAKSTAAHFTFISTAALLAQYAAQPAKD
jgi:hypothetical protein